MLWLFMSIIYWPTIEMSDMSPCFLVLYSTTKQDTRHHDSLFELFVNYRTIIIMRALTVSYQILDISTYHDVIIPICKWYVLTAYKINIMSWRYFVLFILYSMRSDIEDDSCTYIMLRILYSTDHIFVNEKSIHVICTHFYCILPIWCHVTSAPWWREVE